MTTKTISIRERALEALSQHEAALEAAAEEQRHDDRRRAESTLRAALSDRFDLDVPHLAVRWRKDRWQRDLAVLTVERVLFLVEDGSLVACFGREGCDHETFDTVDPATPWESLGDAIRCAGQWAAAPCRDCAEARKAEPEPAEQPKASFGDRLEALIREIASSQFEREIPF